MSKNMIDIHSHILPQIDDGAENIDLIVGMLKGPKKSIIHFCNKSKMRSVLY